MVDKIRYETDDTAWIITQLICLSDELDAIALRLHTLYLLSGMSDDVCEELHYYYSQTKELVYRMEGLTACIRLSDEAFLTCEDRIKQRIQSSLDMHMFYSNGALHGTIDRSFQKSDILSGLISFPTGV